MAGNGVTLVRSKELPQDPAKVLPGSPLAIQGVFIEILRERFAPDAGIEWAWDEDPTKTGILIEASYNEETEARNTTPALYVTRLQTIPAKVVVGDRAGVELKSAKEAFGALTTVAMQIECVSKDEGESAQLGDLTQFTLLAAQDVIQREFGFHDMTHPTLGQTTPYSRDVNHHSTVVEFQVQFWIRWSQTPISPLLQQISQRITASGSNATGYFSEVTLTSLKRGEKIHNE